jgi:hypothetical protein
VVFRKKRPIVWFQDWFLHWDNSPVHTAAIVQWFLAVNGVKMIPPMPIFSRWLFSLSKDEVRTGLPLAVPRELQDEQGGGQLNCRGRCVHCCIVVVVGTLRMTVLKITPYT